MNTVCITGITGQTGSYLCDLLLSKGYKVYGLKRRSSSLNTERIDHVYADPHLNSNLELDYGDLSDYSSLSSWIGDIKPDLFFNMGAQSHVKVSFDIPEYTMDVTGTGVIRALEAIRKNSPKTKFLTASSSEMFGSSPPPQNEKTPFHPRSPYGVAKVAGFYATVNYREAYGLHACNAVSFNHETISDFMPLIFKEGESGLIDIKPISEIVCNHTGIKFDQNIEKYQEGDVTQNLFVWDAEGWTKVKFASGYPHKSSGFNKSPKMINARNAVYMATGTHVAIMHDKSEKEINDISLGDKVNIINLPVIKNEIQSISHDEAKLLGFIVGDGSIFRNAICLTAKNIDALTIYKNIWNNLGGSIRFEKSKSGFTKKLIWHLYLNGNKKWVKDKDIYDSYGYKRVPKIILNSPKEIQHSFLEGYNDADGLKSNLCSYEFKNFKTNSATLASGLIYLINQTTKQKYNITVEESEKWGYKTYYYSINLLSNQYKWSSQSSITKYNIVKPLLGTQSLRQIHKDTKISNNFIYKINKGYVPTGKHHLEKDNSEVKKIIDFSKYDGWFFDLETESGTFHCGIGNGHVHNSPRRGETFVTRKITMAATRIKLGLQKKLYLGNLDAQRDWSHASDIAEAMFKIITAPVADDFVVASGEMHSVKEFAELVFSKLGLNYLDYVEFDPRYLRASEVDALCGDPTKLKTTLGWSPKYSFEDLVNEMIDSDMLLAKKEKLLLEGI